MPAFRAFRVLAWRLTVAWCALTAFAPSAFARLHTIAPPGNSAISQYVEVIQTAAGGRPTASIGGGAGAAASSRHAGNGVVSASTARALDAEGRLGRVDASVARATAPLVSAPAPTVPGSHRGSTGSPATISPPRAPGAASSVIGALTGSSTSGGLGILLPAALALCFFGAAALALSRRRRAT